MIEKIKAHAQSKANENLNFFFSQSRDLVEWNKTALIKVNDHKRTKYLRQSDSEDEKEIITIPVMSPMDYFCKVREKKQFHKWKHGKEPEIPEPEVEPDVEA